MLDSTLNEKYAGLHADLSATEITALMADFNSKLPTPQDDPYARLATLEKVVSVLVSTQLEFVTLITSLMQSRDALAEATADALGSIDIRFNAISKALHAIDTKFEATAAALMVLDNRTTPNPDEAASIAAFRGHSDVLSQEDSTADDTTAEEDTNAAEDALNAMLEALFGGADATSDKELIEQFFADPSATPSEDAGEVTEDETETLLPLFLGDLGSSYSEVEAVGAEIRGALDNLVGNVPASHTAVLYKLIDPDADFEEAMGTLSQLDPAIMEVPQHIRDLMIAWGSGEGSVQAFLEPEMYFAAMVHLCVELGLYNALHG